MPFGRRVAASVTLVLGIDKSVLIRGQGIVQPLQWYAERRRSSSDGRGNCRDCFIHDPLEKSRIGRFYRQFDDAWTVVGVQILNAVDDSRDEFLSCFEQENSLSRLFDGVLPVINGCHAIQHICAGDETLFDQFAPDRNRLFAVLSGHVQQGMSDD